MDGNGLAIKRGDDRVTAAVWRSEWEQIPKCDAELGVGVRISSSMARSLVPTVIGFLFFVGCIRWVFRLYYYYFLFCSPGMLVCCRLMSGFIGVGSSVRDVSFHLFELSEMCSGLDTYTYTYLPVCLFKCCA
eukprot:GHVU01084953.1.p1 GENE.GHVU01084953.1~~GHVU01084953.1.p1  ORF type:complete len:132 (-),score=0.80 GHVU01084953.1:170-565(-)